MKIKPLFLALALGLLLSGCLAGRFVSADADLEQLFVGKSYYEIVDLFGRPDASMNDGMGGTKVAYNSVSLSGTPAADLYRKYTMRNRATRMTGAPMGGITFSFDDAMSCYAVNSDFQHERIKGEKPQKAAKPQDPNKPNKVTPKIPRALEFPYVEHRSPNAEVVSVEKVEVDSTSLTVYFRYCVRTPEHRPIPDYGVNVMEEVYIEDAKTGKRSKLLKAEGISFYPEPTSFAHNVGGYDILVYSLTFAPVAVETEYINIVEPGHSGFNFYKVDIRTPMTTKDELKKN